MDQKVLELKKKNREAYEKGRKLAEDLVETFNTCNGTQQQKGFIDGITECHRTLQQNIMRLVMHLIHELGAQELYDERNEATVKLARRIDDYAGDEFLPFR